jgi:cell division protein FtsW (lipid II flippase)
MDEKKRTTLKRIFAWIYLGLFIFVILNLMIFDFYKDYTLGIYIVMIAVYLLVFRKPVEKGDTGKTDSKNITDTTEEKK